MPASDSYLEAERTPTRRVAFLLRRRRRPRVVTRRLWFLLARIRRRHDLAEARTARGRTRLLSVAEKGAQRVKTR